MQVWAFSQSGVEWAEAVACKWERQRQRQEEIMKKEKK